MKKIMLLLVAILLGCQKERIDINPDNLLLGTWNYSGYENNVLIFSRASDFTDAHCYRFNPDASLVERKNSGFCGTPPISYSNYNGSWQIINDTLIRVDVGYWGGQTDYNIDIESIGTHQLKIVILD